MNYSIGSIIRSRGREWVVLPESTEDTLIVKPLGGIDSEVTGIYIPLERDDIKPAKFDLPEIKPENIGDHKSCKLLRDAIKLGFRSSAGPFRSFAKIAVDPRPYQLVPLLMALKIDPIRLLIADDVGIGKTIEACLIAKELLDRGEIQKFTVLCPPHLAEQWQRELSEKFHLNAELVLASTISRLEKKCGYGNSIFDVCPVTVVSIDFIKSDSRRTEFINACPEFVIVDEAHSCVPGGVTYSHQRYKLLKGLAEDKNRQLVLVTATPHSGNESAFRSLLALINPDFGNLPDDLTGKENESVRRDLSQYFIQRKRADIQGYLEETQFPKRLEAENSYSISPELKQIFEDVIDYTRSTIDEASGDLLKQRIRWWSALSLLRALASSPRAAIESLKNRSQVLDLENKEEMDEFGLENIYDVDEEDSPKDTIVGSDIKLNQNKFAEIAKRISMFEGEKDEKLQQAKKHIKELIKDGFNPVIFCRFINTAEYVAEELRKTFKETVKIDCITGNLEPSDREDRIEELAASKGQRLLVCTDCLSEGINLQNGFDAVFHYDLTWNPTRHEQREGRVDRFGQKKSEIKVFTFYGKDNYVDGIVLNVLIRKHKTIKSSLGISVPVPVNTKDVMDAIFESLLIKKQDSNNESVQMSLFNDESVINMNTKWDLALEREKKSNTVFSQRSIKPEEVLEELKESRKMLGTNDLIDFTKTAMESYGAIFNKQLENLYKINVQESPRVIKEIFGNKNEIKVSFSLPIKEGSVYLNRTHPLVESIASYVTETALDNVADSVAKRLGAIFTDKVKERTVLLLTRYRYHIMSKQNNKERELLVEDCRTIAFSGMFSTPHWLSDEEIQKLIVATPSSNISPQIAAVHLQKIIDNFESIKKYTLEFGSMYAQEVLESHKKVRAAANIKRISDTIKSSGIDPDVLGVYVYLPDGAGV